MFITTEASQLFSIQILRSRTEKIDYLIVGLGNPGEEYEHTLHNAGFDVVDLLGERLKCNYWKTGCGAIYAETETDKGKSVILAKPQSFMNTSGGPVSSIMKEHKLDVKNLIVVHDDLDLEPGKIRVKLGGSAGGHNGIKSIINKLGNTNFTHVKVGVGHPQGKKSVVDWVLSKPQKQFVSDIEIAKQKASEACLALTSDPVAKVQNQFN